MPVSLPLVVLRKRKECLMNSFGSCCVYLHHAERPVTFHNHRKERMEKYTPYRSLGLSENPKKTPQALTIAFCEHTTYL